jgi:hypothetical protein
MVNALGTLAADRDREHPLPVWMTLAGAAMRRDGPIDPGTRSP